MRGLSAFGFQFSVFFLIFFLFVFAVQAAPVGSPASLLEKGQWDFCIEGGYIHKRPMETSTNADNEVSITHGYHARSYGLTNRIVVSARVGGTYGYLYNETSPGVQTRTSLSGGLGLGAQLKGIIYRNEDSGLEWDASTQFLYMRSHHKRGGKANSDWYEWQISTCLIKQLGRFKPYAGVKFSTVDLDFDDGKGNVSSYDEDGSVGPFVGCDIFLGKDQAFVINLEAAFLVGNEFSGGIKYRF